MKRTIMVSSTCSGPLNQYTCSGPSACGETWMGGPNDNYCPFCSSRNLESSPASTELSANAQSDTRKVELVCSSCNKHIYVAGSLKTSEDIVSSMFCPSCGSGDLCEAESDDDSDFADSDNFDEYQESSEESMMDTEQDVEEALESNGDCEDEDSELDQISMVSMATSDGDHVVLACDRKGNPLFRLKKSLVYAEAQPIFGTKSFYNVFHQTAKDIGLFAAVREFGGQIYKPKRIASNADIQALAVQHMEAHVLPKLLECAAVALEATAKGLFPDMANILKASMFDELSARTGAPQEQIVSAIEATVQTGCMPFFTAVISKAIELSQKKPDAYQELKSMVQVATPKTTTIESSITSSEHQEFRQRLEAGNMPVSVSVVEPLSAFNKSSDMRSKIITASSTASVNNLRSIMNLGRK